MRGLDGGIVVVVEQRDGGDDVGNLHGQAAAEDRAPRRLGVGHPVAVVGRRDLVDPREVAEVLTRGAEAVHLRDLLGPDRRRTREVAVRRQRQRLREAKVVVRPRKHVLAEAGTALTVRDLVRPAVLRDAIDEVIEDAAGRSVPRHDRGVRLAGLRLGDAEKRYRRHRAASRIVDRPGPGVSFYVTDPGGVTLHGRPQDIPGDWARRGDGRRGQRGERKQRKRGLDGAPERIRHRFLRGIDRPSETSDLAPSDKNARHRERGEVRSRSATQRAQALYSMRAERTSSQSLGIPKFCFAFGGGSRRRGRAAARSRPRDPATANWDEKGRPATRGSRPP